MGKHAGERLPSARTSDLILTESGSELLVFDTRSSQLHHLNPLATTVWKALDGERNTSEVLETVRMTLGDDVSVDSIQLAIAKLGEAGLLDGSMLAEPAPANRSRRRFLKRAGIAAIPAIVSVTAPMAAAHASDSPDFTCQPGTTLDSPNRQCYDYGLPCCNNEGNCGLEPNGQPRDVTCGTCSFWQWNCPNGEYVQPSNAYGQGEQAYSNGQPLGPAADYCTATFQCR